MTIGVRSASITPGKYRNITGNEATAMGFVAASVFSGRPLFYAKLSNYSGI